jgi:hypothetical protein
MEYNYMMHLLQQPAHYQEAMDMVDINEYINYMILQIYIANYDFPSNNLMLWRPKTVDGKWRFILKDTDFGLSLWDAKEPNENSMEYNTTGDGEKERRLFNALLTLDSFKEEFYSRFAIYLGDILHYNATSHVIDSIRTILTPEMPFHLDRWRPSKWWKYIDAWNEDVNLMRDWCLTRNPYMYNSLNDFFHLNGLTPMTVAIADDLGIAPTLSINDVALHQPTFDGKYFRGKTVRVRCIGSKGEPIGWRIESKINGSGELDTQKLLAAEAEYTIPENCIDLKFTLIRDPEGVIPSDPIETESIESDNIHLSLAANELLVSGLEGVSAVSVFDISGRLIAEVKSARETAAVRLPGKGVYIVRVSNGTRNLSRKIVY